MTREEIIQLIKELDVRFIRFGVFDIDGVLRGKLISTQKFLKAIENHIGFCNVIFGWDVNDACYDNTLVSGWHTGYPDAFSTIDPNSFRKIPWNDGRPFFLGDFSDSPTMAEVCPRSILKKVIKEVEQMGFHPKFSAEFEWFNFLETPASLQQKDFSDLTPLTPGMFGYSVLRTSQNQDYIDDLVDQLYDFGIHLEGIHTETGSGVYEAAITYSDILDAADNAALFKTSVKEIASRHEITATFMAKWSLEFPGCSGHIHQSLWDQEGNNLFTDTTNEFGMSSLAQHYLAGQLYALPYLLPMFAPTTNSYKRYVEGSWAATTKSWGIENRTTAFRFINQNAGSTRIENRVPGADANPYLSMAASLAAGLYGIKNELALEQPPTKGNAYADSSLEQLPKDLSSATKAMKEHRLAAELFGATFADHFIKTREWELTQLDSSDMKQELKRYFEII